MPILRPLSGHGHNLRFLTREDGANTVNEHIDGSETCEGKLRPTKHMITFQWVAMVQILQTSRCQEASIVSEVKDAISTIGIRRCGAGTSMAGRPGRELAARAVSTLRQESPA